MIARRGLLLGILSAGLAPAIVRAELIMQVRKIIVPDETVTFQISTKIFQWNDPNAPPMSGTPEFMLEQMRFLEQELVRVFQVPKGKIIRSSWL